MQSEEERVGGSDHAYDKMGGGGKQERMRREEGGVVETREVSEGNRVKEKCRDAQTHTQFIAYTSINQHSFLLGR